MGNGQNRNRRGGARTRHGPRHGGAGGSDRRAAHLMPPSQVTPAEAGANPAAQSDAPDVIARAEAAEVAEEQFERQAGEMRGGPSAPSTEPGIEIASASAAPSAAEQSAMSEPLLTNEDILPPDAPSDAPPDAEPEAELIMGAQSEAEAASSAEPDRRAPRGRFERFYAPGQRPRLEHNGHGDAPSHGDNGARPAAHQARPMPASPPVPTPAPAQMPELASDEEDDETVVSGPREDVRGTVGELIDALHGLFTHDRAVASQGGSSRCGICYFHFPITELVYREAEGFYVCQPCERALGSARLNMVRRQQRL